GLLRKDAAGEPGARVLERDADQLDIVRADRVDALVLERLGAVADRGQRQQVSLRRRPAHVLLARAALLRADPLAVQVRWLADRAVVFACQDRLSGHVV